MKACPVNAVLYMAFKHSISFATDLAAKNFKHNQFRKMQFPRFSTSTLENLESEQKPISRTGS